MPETNCILRARPRNWRQCGVIKCIVQKGDYEAMKCKLDDSDDTPWKKAKVAGVG